jgi:predicted permease
MKLIRKFRALFRKEELDAEMAEEMRAHLELQTKENEAHGMSPEEAHYAARRAFGGVAQIQERCRDQRCWLWFEQTLADLSFAFRALRKNPGFSSVAVLTLALGIGANTSLFTALNTIMLRPLPAPEADRLAYVTNGRSESFSFPFYERLRQDTGAFSGFAAVQYRAARYELSVDGRTAESVPVQSVTGNFFTVLGVPALLGRTIGLDDDRLGAASPVVVIGHSFWQRRFGADPAVIGRSVQLNNVPLTIVGVMPPGFAGFEVGSNPDLWTPVQLVTQMDPRDSNRLAEGVDWLVLFGRLRDGVTREQAQTELRGIFRRQLEDQVSKNPSRSPEERARILNQTLDLHSGATGYVGVRSQLKQPLIILMASVGVVLLIACTNVAGLLLARGMARQREFSVRAALGAGRGRIARQLATESLLLALMGGSLGLLFAQWGTRFLAAYLVQSDTVVTLEPDGRVLLFTIVVSLLTGVIFGFVPAWRLSRLDLVTAMKHQGSALAGGVRPRLQPALVVAQISLSVLLLAGAGLFARTLYNLRSLDLGFVPGNLIALSVDPGRWRPAPTEVGVLQKRLLTELATLPGVHSVSIGGAGMLSGNGYNTGFAIEGYPPVPDEELRAAVLFAGPQFFETLRIPLLRGREFTLADEPPPGPSGAMATATVVILGETMARKFFGETDPVGRHILTGPKNAVRLEVIGVAKDTKYSRNLREKTPLEYYVPYYGAGVRMPPTFYLRTAQGVAATDVRRIITQVDPRLAIKDLRTMDEVINRLLMRERVIAQIVGFFSVFALFLASLGVYGLLSYGVSQRTREIGVRIALGATVRNVIALVVRQGLVLALTGCALGGIAALLLTRFVATLLYEVKPADPLTFTGVAVLLITVVVAACWLPARRAAKVDPMVALRAE